MKDYKIIDYELDMEDFGGVLVNAEINGRTINLGEQLVEDGKEYRREYPFEASSCWSFINREPVDDGSASFAEICGDVDEGVEIFDSIIENVVIVINEIIKNTGEQPRGLIHF